MKLRAAFLLLAVAVSIVSPLHIRAEVTCAEGTVPITDRNAAGLSGIPDDQPCWDPVDDQIGLDAVHAKQYLLSIAKNLRNSQAPPDVAHIKPLNASFAICAAKFLKAYIDHYGPVYVVSAFRCGPRSPAGIQCDPTENQRAGGAGNSNHQIGAAMDINPAGGNSSYETLRSFALANPGYGVTFPWPGYPSPDVIDKNHMQALNIGRPSCAGVVGIPITPGPGDALQANKTPLQKVLSGLQNFFNPPQQQPAPQEIGSPSNSQIGNAFNPNGSQGMLYSTPIASGSGGTNGSSPSGIPNSPSTPVSSNTNTTDTSAPTKPTTGPSVADLIDAIANPTSTPSSTSTSVGRSVALNDSLENKATLQGTIADSIVRVSSTQPRYMVNAVASQTFVSDDLSRTPVQPQSFSPVSTFAVLENIKTILMRVLSMLRPFGGTPQVTLTQTPATAVLHE